MLGLDNIVEGEGFIKSLTVRDLDAGAAPKRRGPERGCVRRTSRSRTECEPALNHSNPPLSAMALRLGLRPQSRSGGRREAGRIVKSQLRHHANPFWAWEIANLSRERFDKGLCHSRLRCARSALEAAGWDSPALPLG